MIKFLQDYTTKALPPEVFAADQEVERSPESELYFVRLGVAGFVVDGVVVDEDYNPIVRQTVAVITTTDRRFMDTGRGGEVLGLDGPARASSGPGNQVVFAGQPDSIGLSNVEVEQLRTDLAAALAGQGEHAAQVEGLTDKASALEERLLAAESERDRLTGEATVLQTNLADALASLEAAQARILELEAQQPQQPQTAEPQPAETQTAEPAATNKRSK